MPIVKATNADSAPVGAPSNAPVDTSTFEGLGLDQLLVRHLKGKMAIKAPTGIQRSALPQLLSSPLDIDSAHARVEEEDEDDYEAMTAPKVASTIPPPRDVFIQSQTGSGKTLTYLLPIVQALLPLSRLSYIDRSIGTLAIILAPTRELAQQISKVLEQLLSLSLATEGDDRPMTRWLVSGLLTGGSTKTHEKAKLRKGVPILVATPGRLLDHLQNTTSFRFAKTMFLVLDEADRVMDLGFEETVTGIIKALDGRRRAEMAGEKEADIGTMRWGFWDRGRQNILCSATVDGKVEKLAGMALRDPVVFRAEASGLASGMEGVKLEDGSDSKKPVDEAVQKAIDAGSSSTAIQLPVANADKFTPPSQLSQKYVVVPTKLRLVSLVALLRTLVSRRADGQEDKGASVIVFMSSTDAVDFHWKLLGGVQMGQGEGDGEADANAEGAESADEDTANGDTTSAKAAKAKKAKANGKKAAEEPISLSSPLFPDASIQRLHGSLPLRTRLASLAAFAAASETPSILICTSVASRGLDMPLVSSVVQYDLPTEGGANEYVHRVGRTARAGKGGEAWAFVGPSEVDWVPWVGEKMGAAEGEEGKKVGLGQVGVEEVLKKGFGGKGWEFERRATEVQGGFERWVIADDKVCRLITAVLAILLYCDKAAPWSLLDRLKSLYTCASTSLY
jgi:ATP-dependent RNA helicase DDX31/DBP7